MKYMLNAPQQNWEVYRALVSAHDREFARNLSMADRFSRYEDLYRLVCARQRPAEEQERLEKRRWQQKLALRQKQNYVFRFLD